MKIHGPETLNDAVVGVELSGIRQFTYLVRDTPGACALTIGEPDLNTPDAIKEAAKAALDDNDTHYPPGNGYPYLLEEISKFEAQAHGLHYAPRRDHHDRGRHGGAVCQLLHHFERRGRGHHPHPCLRPV